MALKDDDGQILSKNVLDGLTRVGAIAAALATLFAVFLSEEQAKPLAFGVAIVLVAGSSVVFLYRRRRAARLKIVEAPEPLQPHAALRGLLPFEEGDELPRRARDIQELNTLVASSEFRFGVLWGESGCGKTSLLRAGLVPQLRNEKFLPLYIGKPTKEPREAIRAALKRESAELGERVDEDLKQLLRTAAPKGKKVIILFDQFEEFFLTNRTPRSRASFIKWLGEAVADEDLPVAFLVGIRADFGLRLHDLAEHIPEPTSTHSTYKLENFDAERAKQIFVAAAKADAIPFEPALIEAVVSDLETEEFIRPAELQIVGTRLKRKNVLNLNRYELLGRARGILSSYIGDEIKQSASEQAARLVLRLMCADAVDTKSPTDLGLDDILRGMGGSGQAAGATLPGRPEDVQAILNQFVAARILIHTDDDKYNLVHDYLAPYVRTATEGTETNVERANRLLKRYVAEYKEDPKTRIPFGRVRSIQKYASAEVKSGERARELINKSRRAFYATTVGSVLAVPLAVVLALYLFLANSYYLSIDEFTGDSSRIVVRSGRPELKFVPGFGQIVVQTDFTVGDLDASSKIRDEILREQVTGFWFELGEGGYQSWGEQIVIRLSPIPRVHALRLLGQPERAVELSLNFLNDQQANSEMHRVAAQLLGELAQTSSQAITPNMVQALRDAATDSQADSYLRLSAANALGQLAQANPQTAAQAVMPEVIQALSDLIADPKVDPSLRSSAADALGRLAQANPQIAAQAVTPEVIQALSDLAANPNSRSDTAYTLGQLAQANPQIAAQAVTPEVLQALSDLATDPKVDPYWRSSAADALGQLAQANPQVVPEVLQALSDLATDPKVDPYWRSSAADALGQLAQANPQVVPKVIQALSDLVADPKVDPSLRSSAAAALGRLAQANPQAVTPEVLQALSDLATDPKVDLSWRSSAADALGQLAQAKSRTATPVIQTLIALLRANKDSTGRRAEAYALFVIAVKDPGQERTIRDELKELLDSPEPHWRIAASKVLEMLAIGDLVQEAHADPEQIAHLKSRIIAFQSSSEEHLRFAASIALQEIDELETGKK